MRYIPLLRPASFATLPRDLAWTYVEAPRYITARPDLPVSRHYHGVIECRELTQDEITGFDLRPVASSPRTVLRAVVDRCIAEGSPVVVELLDD